MPYSRDAGRRLRPGRPGGGHGPCRHPGVDLLPVLSPVLRADLLGGQGQGAGPALRQGLQRLDDRRVVRQRPRVASSRWSSFLCGTRPRRRKEIERCAAKGARSFAFSENPEPLGLPTIHDPGRYWDPVMAAAQDTQMVVSHARRLVLHDADHLHGRPGPGQPHLRRGASSGNACWPGSSATTSSACPA